MRAWSPLVAVATAATIVACAAQQHRVADGTLAPSGAIILPGATELVTAKFTDEQETDRAVFDSGPGTVARVVGAMTTGIQPTRYHGKAALLLTKMSRRGASVFIDTALVLRDGLVPVWEISNNSRGVHTRFEYDGPTVRLTSTSPDSSHAATHTYPRRVFHFNELDAIVRAIPLRTGYHAIVPLYSEGDDSLEMDTVAVVGHHGRTWDVRFADPVIVTHYGVDDVTRRIVSTEITRQGGRPWRTRLIHDTDQMQDSKVSAE